MIAGQDEAPLLDAIKRHARANRVPFHVPAHLGRPLPGFKGLERAGLFSLDVTELPGLDDLHCPTGPLKKAQDLAAALFGARSTFFLVNGVTVGILAAHLYYGGKGKKVILPRNAHRSQYSGLILAGSTPVYVPVAWQEGIAANVTLHDARKALAAHPGAAAFFVTSPGYHGACADLASLRGMTAKLGMPLVVDEAHGTYLSLSSQLPAGAADVAADMWFQSTHKTGGALTQGGMLHVGNATVDIHRLAFYLSLLQTSSPSYPIMASLDESRRLLAQEGRERVEKLAGLAARMREDIQGLPGIEVLKFTSFALDPLKLVLSLDGGGVPGPNLLHYLRSRGVEPELAGFRHLLCIISLFHTAGQLRALRKALERARTDLGGGEKAHEPSMPMPPLPLPLQVLPPGEAVSKSCEALPLSKARGRVAAELVVPSPPGIPLLVPGEEISLEVLEYLKMLKRAGFACQMADPTLNTLKVLLK